MAGQVYIIGGLVDDSVKKDTSREFSLEARLTTARLPIPEWMVRREGGSYKQILTINQVLRHSTTVLVGALNCEGV